ncbi:hypothetical protein H9P43_008037 [Blastocladiella emersonii ATCC 22665]|nr:hypothetical protein H9P43_008037 [Blastocladiella emersonii ATCC 22665]
MAPTKVYVIGVGMTKFIKPGRADGPDYPVLAREALAKALLDANITYDAVEQAYVGYCYGDSTAGQRALYELGRTSIPVVNVNNNCSTGSSALYLARNAVAAGQAECALALGFEKMAPGSLASVWTDRAPPLAPHLSVIGAKHELDPRKPMAPTIFGLAGIEYCEERGVTDEAAQRKLMSKIAWKNHLHSTKNPYSQFRDEYTLEQIEKSRKVFGPLTMLQCCPTSDGSACAILASEDFVRRHNLEAQAVEVAGMAMATDTDASFSTFFTGSDGLGGEGSIDERAVKFTAIAGSEMTRTATRKALAQAQVPISAVRVVELHDCFSANELITYDALGLTPNSLDFVASLTQQPHGVIGTAGAGQDVTVNPSGGLISKGHPLGATGLAQCAELTWQLRGWCGDRQVPGQLDVALQHNLGLGGAAVVAVYRRTPDLGKPKPAAQGNAKWEDPRVRFGYNPAVEARPISDHQVATVRAKPTLPAHLKASL